MTESRKEYLRNYLREYRKTHPEYAARQREAHRQSYRTYHSDRLRYQRKYYQAHKKEVPK